MVDFGVLFYVAEHEVYFVVSDKCVNFAASFRLNDLKSSPFETVVASGGEFYL